jgi:hypothetical protein
VGVGNLFDAAGRAGAIEKRAVSAPEVLTKGASVHIGDFRARCRRTYFNITKLFGSEGAARRHPEPPIEIEAIAVFRRNGGG